MAESWDLNHVLKWSIECEDNPEGHPGVIVYDDVTISISSHPEDTHASNDGHGPDSSVTVFQLARYDDNTMSRGSPESDQDSNCSLEEEEEDTEEDK